MYTNPETKIERPPKPVDPSGWTDYYWNDKVKGSPYGGSWAPTKSAKAKLYDQLGAAGVTQKDGAWATPVQKASGNADRLLGYAKLNSFLAGADTQTILAKFPELKSVYQAYMPVFEQFHVQRAAQGMPSYIASSRNGGSGATTPEESMNQWLFQLARLRGSEEFGTPVMSDAEFAPYTQLQGSQGLTSWLDKYGTESTGWMEKNLPTILGALSLAGLNPVGALAKGLGSSLGSQALGQAAASAAVSAATGGNALQSALSGLAGSVLNKAQSSGGALTRGVAGAADAALGGGNPLLGAAGALLPQTQTNQSSTGGQTNMGTFDIKDLLGSAAVGALLNKSAPTGAAAGAALGLLSGNSSILPDNTTGDLLRAAIQGYAQNKLVGGQGGAGAAAGVTNALYDKYLAGGSTDDALRALLGLAGGNSQSLVADASQNQAVWNRVLDLFGAGQNQQAASAPQQVPDLLSLYQQYYDRLPTQDTADFESTLEKQYTLARRQLEQDYRQQREALNADLNRRGLFSSGLALKQQGELSQTFNDALAAASYDKALNALTAQEAAHKDRENMAWDLAKNAQSMLAKGVQPVQTSSASAQGGGSLFDVMRNTLLNRVAQSGSGAQQSSGYTSPFTTAAGRATTVASQSPATSVPANATQYRVTDPTSQFSAAQSKVGSSGSGVTWFRPQTQRSTPHYTSGYFQTTGARKSTYLT